MYDPLSLTSLAKESSILVLLYDIIVLDFLELNSTSTFLLFWPLITTIWHPSNRDYQPTHYIVILHVDNDNKNDCKTIRKKNNNTQIYYGKPLSGKTTSRGGDIH